MEIPASWLDVLDRLHRNGHPEAFIGGGALRDLDNGKPIKDVDIFLRGAKFHELSNWLPHLVISDCTANTNEYEEHFAEIERVFEGRTGKEGDLPFNIIVCDGPQDPSHYQFYHLSRFDLGICKIGHDGRRVRRMQEYVVDVTARTLTICNQARPEASLARAARIQRRAYQDWTVVTNPYATTDGMEPEDL